MSPAPVKANAECYATSRPSTVEIMGGTAADDLHEFADRALRTDEDILVAEDCDDIDEYADDSQELEPLSLWHRGRAVCTLSRILAVTAITASLTVGSGAWHAVDRGLSTGGTSGSTPTGQSNRPAGTTTSSTESSSASHTVRSTSADATAALRRTTH
jgi:hypothetical protein